MNNPDIYYNIMKKKVMSNIFFASNAAFFLIVAFQNWLIEPTCIWTCFLCSLLIFIPSSIFLVLLKEGVVPGQSKHAHVLWTAGTIFSAAVCCTNFGIVVCLFWLEPLLSITEKVGALLQDFETVSTIATSGAALLGALGLVLSAATGYLKTQKYGIPFHLARFRATEHIGALIYFLVLWGFGIAVPMFITFSQFDPRAIWILAWASLLVHVYLSTRIRWPHMSKTLRIILTILIPAAFACCCSNLPLYFSGEGTSKDVAFGCGIALLIYWVLLIVSALVFPLPGGDTVIVETDNCLFLVAVCHDADKWILVPCEAENGRYMYEPGHFEIRSIEKLPTRCIGSEFIVSPFREKSIFERHCDEVAASNIRAREAHAALKRRHTPLDRRTDSKR